MDMRKLHELVKDAEACLQPLVEGRGNRSATALGLLAAWYGRILDIHEPAANAIAALWDQLPGTTEKELAGWRDPADELLLGGKGPLFVDKAGAIAGDKAERIAALQKGFSEGPLKMAKEKKPSLIIKRPMEPKQGKQQTEQVERAVKGLVAMNADALQQRQKLTGEMEKCWEAFVGTVEDLDEGSKARIEKVLETVQFERMDEFFDAMARALDAWSSSTFGANSPLKQAYVDSLAETLARFVSRRNVLALQRPDVGHTMLGLPAKRTEEAGASEASEAKAAGGGGGGGGGKGKGGKGGGGGGKGGGKADSPGGALQLAVEKLLAKDVDSPDVDAVLQDLEAQVKEHGRELCTRLMDKALSALEVKEGEEPLAKQLKDRQDLGELMVKAMYVKLGADGAAASGSRSELHRVFEELLLRQRSGEGLLWAEDMEPLEKEHDTKTIKVLPRDLDVSARRRARFCMQLNALSPLQRYDVLDSIALRFAIPATVDESSTPEQKSTIAVSLPDAFDSPDGPNDVLERLGDPLSIFTGYAHLLRHRGILPLSPPDVKPEKGAGKQAAATALEGMDAPGRRVARLCNSLLHNGDGLPSESAMIVLRLQHTTKQEYAEVIQKVTGELPIEIAKRVQAAQEGKPVPELPEDAESDPVFGPYIEFDWRESLPAEDKKRLHAEWRDDIVTAIKALEEGDCNLGRRMVATLKLFLADRCGASPLEVDVSSGRIGTWLAKLSHQDLVLLRLFLLDHLGMRASATPTHIRAAVMDWQRGAEDEMWGLELVTEGGGAAGGAGKQGGKGGKGGDSGPAAAAGAGIPRGKVRMSVKAYEALCRRHEKRTRREELHKRTAFTLARLLKAAGKSITPPPGAGSASSAASAAAGAGAAASTTSKKKGKGGAGDAAAPGAPAGAAPTDVAFASLVKDVEPLPVPEGADPKVLIDLLADQYQDIVDADDPAAADMLLKALALLDNRAVASNAEYDVLLEQLLEGSAEGAALKLGTEKAEKGALYELTSLNTATSADVSEAPVFSVRDAVEELVRVVVLEEVHKDVTAVARKQLEGLVAVWNSILENSADRDQLWEKLQSRTSPWASTSLRKMAGEVSAASWSSGEAAAKKLQDARRDALKTALTLQARVLRLSVLSTAVRQKDAEEYATKLTSKLRHMATDTGKPTKTDDPAAGAKGAKSKARNTSSNATAAADASSSTKLYDNLKAEQDSATAEATWLRETNMRAKNLAERYMTSANAAYMLPAGLGGRPLETSSSTLADLMVDALEGLQVLMYHLTLLDSVIETVQVQARVAVGGALRNDLLSPGIVGTEVINGFLDNRLKTFVAEQATFVVAREAEAEKRKLAEKIRKQQEEKTAREKEKAEKEELKRQEEKKQKMEEEKRLAQEKKKKEEAEAAEKKRQAEKNKIEFEGDDEEEDSQASTAGRGAGGKGIQAAQPPPAAQQQAAGAGGVKAKLQEKLQQQGQGQHGSRQPPPLQQPPQQQGPSGAGKPGKENAGAHAPGAGKAAPATAAPAGKEGREGPGKPAPPPQSKSIPPPAPPVQQQQSQGSRGQGAQSQKGGPTYQLVGGKDGKGGAQGAQGGKGGAAQQQLQPQQPPPQQPPGAGKSSVKGAQPPPPAPGKAAPQPQAVPGFHHDEPAGEGGRGARRRKGGRGLGAGGAGGAGGAADVEGGTGRVRVELLSDQVLEDNEYPLKYPYPFTAPEGWEVIEGFLLPASGEEMQEFRKAAAETNLEDPTTRREFWLAAVGNVYKNKRVEDMPDLPTDVYVVARADRIMQRQEARRAAAQPQAQPGEGQPQLPFGVAADLGQPVPAPPPGGMPYGAPGAPVPPQLQHNPYGRPGPHGMPGPMFPQPPVPGIAPPPLMPGMLPFRPGMMPPFQPYPGGHMPPPGMQPPSMPPPGMQPPAMGGYMPGMAPQAQAAAPAQVEDEDEEDNDNLLGLLGVVSNAPAPPKPAVVSVQVQPVISAAPGPYGAQVPPYGAPPPPYGPAAGGYMPHMAAAAAPSYVSAPAAPAAAAAWEPAPAAAAADGWGGSMADVAPASDKPAAPAPAPAPAAPKPLSWADKIKASKKLEEMPEAVRPTLLPAPVDHGGYDDEYSDDDDDEGYQEALAASLHDNKDVAFPALGAARPGAGRGAGAWGVGMGVAAAPSSDAAAAGGGGNTAGTGLVNRQGEYNCFLNVIIQCLWHCTDFRAAMRPMRPEEYEAGHPVVAALLRLFKALDSADAAAHGLAAPGERQVVDPSELRVALEGLGIRAGEMNDPSEVLSSVFESLNRAPGLAAPGPLPDLSGMQGDADMSRVLSTVDRLFGLLLSEEVRCTQKGCDKTTHRLAPHIEYHVVVAAAGLRETRMVLAMDMPESDMTTGRLLREIERQHMKRCDKDPPHYGCNNPTHVTRTLHNIPNVFSVLLAWEPDVQGDTIAETLQCVDTVLQPTEIFMPGACPHNLPSYALHGMFCYYGQHYFAFINRGGVEEAEQEWVMFDDATVSTIGSWSAVISKCRVGRIQPSVLFYQTHKARLGYR
eukprot:XP_001691026.1 predicted protein [Chlamydomonas reinhardtii]